MRSRNEEQDEYLSRSKGATGLQSLLRGIIENFSRTGWNDRYGKKCFHLLKELELIEQLELPAGTTNIIDKSAFKEQPKSLARLK